MSQLTTATALSLKAGFASGLAYGLAVATNNPDGVSAAFVAVVCTSPIVLAGLRRAFEQALASLLGGAIAVAIAITGMPLGLGLGLSVGLSILVVHALRVGRAYPVAAFTAVYIFLLDMGGPGLSLQVRAMSVGLGAVVATILNILVSSMYYRRIYRERTRLAVAAVAEHISKLAEGPPTSIRPVFDVLSELARDVALAEKELGFRRDANRQALREQAEQIETLIRLSHFSADLALVVNEAGEPLTESDRALFKHVAAVLCGESPSPPSGLGEIGTRVLAALDRFERSVQHSTA